MSDDYKIGIMSAEEIAKLPVEEDCLECESASEHDRHLENKKLTRALDYAIEKLKSLNQNLAVARIEQLLLLDE